MSAPLAKIFVYNTLPAKREEFRPLKSGEVSLYSCGPTVYSYTHVGNARASISADLVARVFALAGYKVRWASNITDVDDKIINAANREGKSSEEIARTFEEQYIREMDALAVQSPAVRPRATEHIPEMLSMIEGLIQKGHAYPAETPYGKDVYFRVESFKPYGKLSKRNLDDMLAGARVEPGEMKQMPLDFALWKAAKPGEPEWKSPWGAGRPGWHIECSAMVGKHFPDGLDIHMGGLDLVFPHHENEIAQAEALTNKTFAPYWLHNGLLTIGREKMSKSLGNVFLTKDFIAKFGAETLRLLFLQQQYRSPIDFSDESILRTEGLVIRIYKAQKILEEQGIPVVLKENSLTKEMSEALFDDFNTAKALGFFLKQLRQAFKTNDRADWEAWASGLSLFQKIYAVGTRAPAEALKEIEDRRFARMGKDGDFCKRIEDTLRLREELRAQKKFEEADQLRKDLEAEGLMIMDGPDGSAWAVKPT
jgi:cysteinyl-tRNA synthetase